MRDYVLAGSHKAAMPSLAGWCDEAAVVHWDQVEEALPAWPEADRRLRREGRPSKIRHPGPNHAGLAHDAPRTGLTGPIRPAGRT